MNQLTNTQAKLLETIALIAKEERALVDHPEHEHSIAASICSLEKVRNQLKNGLESETD